MPFLKRGGDPAEHFERGREHALRGEYERAIHEFDRAIKLRPDVAEAYQERGLAHARAGNELAAAMDFEWALDAGGSLQLRVDAHYNAGHAYEQLKDWRSALVHYDAAIELHPAHSKAWCNRGNVLLQEGEFEKARDSHTKAIELNPSDFRAYWGRAIANNQLNRVDLVVQDLHKYLETAPTNDPNIEMARRLLLQLT